MTFYKHDPHAFVVHPRNHDMTNKVTVSIVDKHTGKPFGHAATVTIAIAGNPPLPSKRSQHGKAVFTGLPAGRYLASATFPGHAFVPAIERKDGSDQCVLLAFKQRDVHWGIDSNLGSTPGAQIKLDQLDKIHGEHIAFVARYLSVDVLSPQEQRAHAAHPDQPTREVGHPKLSRQEARRYTDDRRKIVAVWERTKFRAIELHSLDKEFHAGQRDGRAALAQLDEIRAPDNAVCYFTADFDLKDRAHPAGQLALVQRYFEGINDAVKDPARIGVYGTYDCIVRLYAQGLVTWGWQMTFGSKGLVIDDRVHLYQYDIFPAYDPVALGVGGGGALDLDCAVRPDYGGFFVKTE